MIQSKLFQTVWTSLNSLWVILKLLESTFFKMIIKLMNFYWLSFGLRFRSCVLSLMCVLMIMYVVCAPPPPPPADFSSALSSRLASSLSDLYAADMEEDRKSPYSSLSPSSPSSPSSLSISPAPSPLAPPSLACYVNGPRCVKHEINNNSGPFVGSVAPSAGKGFVRSGLQDFSPYSSRGPYSAMKGPSGRYLSRSIPVSPPSAAAVQPHPHADWFLVFISFMVYENWTWWPSPHT